MNVKTHPQIRRYINALLIAALILIGISPACKFISGEAFAMEICKTDGTIVIMVMNEDGTVTEQEKPANTHTNTDCAFCFTSQNIKPFTAADLKTLTPELSGQNGLLAQSDAIARQSANHLYAPRGPPTSVV